MNRPAEPAVALAPKSRLDGYSCCGDNWIDPMQDVKARLEKLLNDAEDCRLISKLATNPAKRLAFNALADEYLRMARDIETLLASGNLPRDSEI